MNQRPDLHRPDLHRPEFPELLPPDAPHAQRLMAPGSWILPAFIAGVVFWVVAILLLF